MKSRLVSLLLIAILLRSFTQWFGDDDNLLSLS
jgi:hypothetical protein